MLYRIIIIKSLCITGLFLTSVTASATSVLFSSKEPLNAVLTAPLTSIHKQKKKDVRLYMDGKVSYEVHGSDPVQLPVKVRTRGNFRRLNCTNPPLTLNFKKTENKDTLMVGQDKLKLVAPCKRSDSYRELVALEYLAYQIFEMLSPYHFKTRLMNLGYVDTDKKKDPWKAPAFVIEEITDVASRTEMKDKTVKTANRHKMDHAQTALVELFQLFLGNTDYSTLKGPPGSNCCHNAKVIGVKGKDSILVPVPYDFDASGFINARYSAPSEQYPIRSTTQRYFTGWCKEERFFRGAIDKFIDHKSDIYSMMTDSGLLSEKTVKKKLGFIDKFYDIIEDEKQIQRQVLKRCRGNVIPAPSSKPVSEPATATAAATDSA